MQRTQDAILDTLKERGKVNINELAEASGVKPITVRHHLNALQAEGLVAIEEERQGVGRPRHLYYLTEAGHNRFPQKYHVLIERLLDQLKDTLAPAQVGLLLEQLGTQLGDEVRDEVESLPFDEQLSGLAAVLTREGFMADWERSGNTIRVNERHCPYFHVGQFHPEVCTIDETLIRVALEVEAVTKSACVLDGDNMCTFELNVTGPGTWADDVIELTERNPHE